MRIRLCDLLKVIREVSRPDRHGTSSVYKACIKDTLVSRYLCPEEVVTGGRLKRLRQSQGVSSGSGLCSLCPGLRAIVTLGH